MQEYKDEDWFKKNKNDSLGVQPTDRKIKVGRLKLGFIIVVKTQKCCCI